MNEDFNWKTYLFLNPDLDQNCNEEEATQHYLSYGRFENRKYKKINLPNDFDWQIYMELNTDLKPKTQKNAIHHYLNHGYYENRPYQKLPLSFIKPDTVCHITHNFGGGTEVYINNIITIFSNSNHIVIKIINDTFFNINDKTYPLNSFSQIINNVKLIVVHHLLYNTNHKYMINTKFIDFLKFTKIIKFLIIHDYFLFFPDNPNPIKSKWTNPSSYYIENTKSFFYLFNKIYFNSNNCYQNYLKYINPIQNSIILNVVPDIDYYNKRIFPPSKNKYIIGLVGDIGCEHKGRFLANNIIHMFYKEKVDNYHFVIFGNCDIKLPNLTVTGFYNNGDIYHLFRQYDVDYFLFVSTFEETYSFTLSLAIHTGLPILYNNIGSYTERLKEYSNCFSFDENEYAKVINIFKNIEEKYINPNNTKNKIYDQPVLYKNMPEWNHYLNHNITTFCLDEIKNHLTNKIVCFMHICNTQVDGKYFGKEILLDQIQYIKNTGLYDQLDYIFITLIGENIHLINDYKIKVIYYSNDNNEWEFPHTQNIKYFSDVIPENIKILQIHTKGVLNKPGSYKWRKYLEYFLIEKHELCLKMLDHYYAVSTNAQYYFDSVNKYRNHFSGNFWWCNSNHIKNLPQIEFNKDRHIVEHWLMGNLEKYDYRYFLSLHHTPYDLYNQMIQPEEYNLELIKTNVCESLKTDFIKKQPIYGVYFICCIGPYLNTVKNQMNKLVQSELYEITDQIICFICRATNECIDFIKQYKKIKIISTQENLYEKFAINQYKEHLPTNTNYYMYYMHTKGVTREKKCFEDWRILCEYFTIDKWRLSIELLKYYDCVGTNLKNFPKKHYSGNFWWSKSEHLNRLRNVNDGYLSTEMYICSYIKTNYVSIYQSYVTHGNTEHPPSLYNKFTNQELLDKLCIIPDLNEGDKQCISFCGEIDPYNEPPILHR